jgi:hypothetical protein
MLTLSGWGVDNKLSFPSPHSTFLDIFRETAPSSHFFLFIHYNLRYLFDGVGKTISRYRVALRRGIRFSNESTVPVRLCDKLPVVSL